MIKISKRLETVASLVSSGNRLADVGTDHAYIPIWLAEQGRIPSAIAMDINEGPLQRARQNVEKYGYEGQIVLRLSDGLDELEPGDADTYPGQGDFSNGAGADTSAPVGIDPIPAFSPRKRLPYPAGENGAG